MSVEQSVIIAPIPEPISSATGFNSTFDAVWAQQMSALKLTATGALVEALHVFKSLTGHETMTLLHMRGLLLRDSAQDRFPNIGEQTGNIEGD